jgi:hypothetical protein
MSRRRRNNDSCRNCGDVSVVDEDTFRPTGYCVACSAVASQAARQETQAARRADRTSVVVDTDTDSGPVNGPYHCVNTYRGEVWVNADGEPL